jgi:geranylgeranyl reductase family protein
VAVDVTGAAGDWDLVVVGAGPAGAATALGALHRSPGLSVALLDRMAFPRDKACGDGVAPGVLDLLAGVGVTGVLADRTPVRRLVLRRGDVVVDRVMRRDAWVVPRTVFDARLVDAARSSGATLLAHRVRAIETDRTGVTVDGRLRARVVVGADGVQSVVRRSMGCPRGPVAVAVRGYAPVTPGTQGTQTIVFGDGCQPAYAWSFDRGDGLANVGYGEALRPGRGKPTRQALLERLEALLPAVARGATHRPTEWRGHHLPLSSWRWTHGRGPVLLTGDAAGLVNPLTGEGIHHAVRTGLMAGRAAADAIAARDPGAAAARYRRLGDLVLTRHLRHVAVAARLARRSRVLTAGLTCARADQRVFDDLVELGLADGPITPALARGIARGLLHRIPEGAAYR